MTLEGLQFIVNCLDTVSVTGVQSSKSLINSVGMIDNLARKMQEHGIKSTDELFNILEEDSEKEEEKN